MLTDYFSIVGNANINTIRAFRFLSPLLSRYSSDSEGWKNEIHCSGERHEKPISNAIHFHTCEHTSLVSFIRIIIFQRISTIFSATAKEKTAAQTFSSYNIEK